MALITVDCVTINSGSPWASARFWAELLGGEPRDTGNGYVLLDPGPGRVRLLFQQTDRPNRDPGWIHLDCSAEERDAAIARVAELGGRVVDHRGDSNGTWTVLADPEGNLFCL